MNERTNPEKALPDCIDPHASPRAKLFRQALDFKFDKRNLPGLRRPAKAMGLGVALADYLSRKAIL